MSGSDKFLYKFSSTFPISMTIYIIPIQCMDAKFERVKISLFELRNGIFYDTRLVKLMIGINLSWQSNARGKQH